MFVHGCCLSSKTWETIPDGRMGWSEYFVRRNPGQRTNAGILDATHQFAWTVFRFGPKYGEGFADEQFPLEAVEMLR